MSSTIPANWRDREVAAIQNTADWFKARCGCFTASAVGRLLERLKKDGSRTKKGKDYITDVIAERLTGTAAEHYVSYFMDRGRETEPEARGAYEVAHECLIDQVGFVLHPSIKWFGASPDGVLNGNVGWEVKCPSSSTHLEYLMGDCEMVDGVPAEYVPQCDSGMACLGLDEWIFASYHADFPPHLQLYSARLKRDEKRIAALEYAVIEANAEVEAVLARLAKTPRD
jgi:hypothetical protein